MSPCGPPGGAAVRAGDVEPQAAVCVRAERARVDAGAQRHRQGAHGCTAAPVAPQLHLSHPAVL